MEFNDNYPSYELMAHHSEEDGKKLRRRLWNVFWLLLGITIAEIIIGMYAKNWGLQLEGGKSTLSLKFIFLTLTLVKAAYIVLTFMHLGDEKKIFKYVILVPYITFIIYLVFIALTEGDYSFDMRAWF